MDKIIDLLEKLERKIRRHQSLKRQVEILNFWVNNPELECLRFQKDYDDTIFLAECRLRDGYNMDTYISRVEAAGFVNIILWSDTVEYLQEYLPVDVYWEYERPTELEEELEYFIKEIEKVV